MRVNFNASGLLEKSILNSSFKDSSIVIYDLKIEKLPASVYNRRVKTSGMYAIMPRVAVNSIIGLYSIIYFSKEEKDDGFLIFLEISFTIGQFSYSIDDLTQEKVRIILRNIILAIHGKKNRISSIQKYFKNTNVTILKGEQ